MKLVIVDMQGFCLPDFYPKEMAFMSGSQTAHYLFKPPFPYTSLSEDLKKQVKYLEGHHHGLQYNDGCINYDMIDDILRKHLINATIVYVKGHQKEKFLRDKLCELEDASAIPSIINIENYNGPFELTPVFNKTIPYCFNHSLSKCVCSLRNCKQLYDWIYSRLPK